MKKMRLQIAQLFLLLFLFKIFYFKVPRKMSKALIHVKIWDYFSAFLQQKISVSLRIQQNAIVFHNQSHNILSSQYFVLPLSLNTALCLILILLGYISTSCCQEYSWMWMMHFSSVAFAELCLQCEFIIPLFFLALQDYKMFLFYLINVS